MFIDAAQLVRRNWHFLIGAILASGLVLGAARHVGNTTPVNSVVPGASGALVIDNVAYEFAPETCFIDDNTFVASGGGEMDGDDYRVSASPSVIELTFGSAVEAATIPENSRWEKTNGAFDWNVEGSKLDAAVELFERGKAEGPGRLAWLTISCDS